MRATDESVALAMYINTFLNEYAPSQKTKSEHTLKAYKDTLSLYIGFLETEKGVNPNNLSTECFSVSYVEDWLLWLMAHRSCSPETCNNRLASLRAFLKYLGGKDVSYLHLSQAASQIVRKKAYAKKVTGMSKKAVAALLDSPDPSTKAGRRDIALMVVLYSTAARIDEILSMKIEQLHLDTDKPNITVIGKRGKVRTLYLLPKATAHQLRHAKASHWLEDGMNIVQISFLLGHAQLQTTRVYLDITTEQEAKALATLEDENDKSVPKKWRSADGSLASLLVYDR